MDKKEKNKTSNMMKQIQSILTILLMFCLNNAAWSGNITGPKIAVVRWGTTTFAPIEGQQMTFHKNNNPALGVEYLHIFDANFSIGGEFQYQTADLVSASYDPAPSYGYASVYQLLLVSNYFFPIDKQTKVFIGAGFGASSIGINTRYDATLNGYACHASTGIEFKFTRRVGLTLGYKLSYVSAEDSHNVLKTNMQEINLRLNLYSAK